MRRYMVGPKRGWARRAELMDSAVAAVSWPGKSLNKTYRRVVAVDSKIAHKWQDWRAVDELHGVRVGRLRIDTPYMSASWQGKYNAYGVCVWDWPSLGGKAAAAMNERYMWSIVPSLAAWPIVFMELGPGSLAAALLLVRALPEIQRPSQDPLNDTHGASQGCLERNEAPPLKPLQNKLLGMWGCFGVKISTPGSTLHVFERGNAILVTP
eukprot:scaffold238726_cov19-Tisochrysis_lutea.AAC.3